MATFGKTLTPFYLNIWSHWTCNSQIGMQPKMMPGTTYVLSKSTLNWIKTFCKRFVLLTRASLVRPKVHLHLALVHDQIIETYLLITTTCNQCDQIDGCLFNFWPFAAMKICPIDCNNLKVLPRLVAKLAKVF